MSLPLPELHSHTRTNTIIFIQSPAQDSQSGQIDVKWGWLTLSDASIAHHNKQQQQHQQHLTHKSIYVVFTQYNTCTKTNCTMAWFTDLTNLFIIINNKQQQNLRLTRHSFLSILSISNLYGWDWSYAMIEELFEVTCVTLAILITSVCLQVSMSNEYLYRNFALTQRIISQNAATVAKFITPFSA